MGQKRSKRHKGRSRQPAKGVPRPDERRAKRPAVEAWYSAARLLLSRMSKGWRLVVFERRLYVMREDLWQACRVDPECFRAKEEGLCFDLGPVWVFPRR